MMDFSSEDFLDFLERDNDGYDIGQELQDQALGNDVAESSAEPDPITLEKLDSTLQELKSAICVMSHLLEEFVKDKREVQQYQSCTPSSSSSELCLTPNRKKDNILAVRQEVRKAYLALEADADEFPGWALSKSPESNYKSPQNQATLRKLVEEVKISNPSFSEKDIKNAAYRFFCTHKEAESVSRRGLSENKRVYKRRYERILRKKKERESVILKSSKLSNEAKEKWLKVITPEFMSSEESNDEEDSVTVHPITWRAPCVQRMFDQIDEFNLKNKSGHSNRLMKPRQKGSVSQRPLPVIDKDMQWAVV